MKTLAILLGEHPCIVNILFGPMTVHYREVLLYSVACRAYFRGLYAIAVCVQFHGYEFILYPAQKPAKQ